MSTSKVQKATAVDTPEVRMQKLYRTLHDQLDGSYLEKAVKTCNRILRVAPNDNLARHTKLQLLIALENYPAALLLLHETKKDGDVSSLEEIYCLYKTHCVAEAEQAIAALDEEAKEDRAVQLLEAQVTFRSEDFERSRDIYEELLATVDQDSPEVPDLQTNLAAAAHHLEFISAVPNLLSTSAVPPLDRLESNPVAPLIHSHPLYKPVLIASSSKARAAPVAQTGKAKPTLDPYRWQPKRERPGFAEEIVRKREQERGRKKQQAQGLTQGASEPVPAKGATTGGGGGAGKKKKGKR